MNGAELRRRARAWSHVAESALKRRLDPDWVPRPHAGHFILTYTCNLKCGGCPSWTVKEHDDLSLAEWTNVFRQLRSLDLVKILGGEPTVRKDLPQILSAVRTEVDPYVLQLTTNGMLTRRTVEAVEAVGWPGLQLRVSVDGTEQTHDRMRGVPGSHKIVVATVRKLAELRPRYGFKFGINFALTDDSVHELDDMLRFAEEVGADLIPGVSVDPFLVSPQPPEVQQQKVVFLKDPERALQALLDARVGTRRELPFLDHTISRFLTRRTFSAQLHGQQKRFTCRELRDLMYVLPNGDLVRCGMDHSPVGNLRRQTVDELWFGADIQRFRAKVDACPGCLQASIQILSRVYGGCLFDG